MDKNTVTEYASLIKGQLVLQEMLLEYHVKLEAIVELTLAANLLEYPKEKLHDLFWTIGDLVVGARVVNENLISQLNSFCALLTLSEVPLTKH